MDKEVIEIIVIVNGEIYDIPSLFKDEYNADMVISDYMKNGKRVVELTIPEEE